MDRRERLALGMAMGIAAAALAPRAHPADAAAGARIFATECSDCHSVREGKDKKGPSLFAIVDAKVASGPAFAYSAAMRAAGGTWTRERLSAYVADPRAAVPGTKMKYDGLADANARDSLLAWLATASKP